MQEQVRDLQELAARLAQGPAFVILGEGAAESRLEPSSQYSWSGVYTSRLDKTVADQLRADWRTVTSTGAMSSTPSRNQADLEVRYLFGAHHLTDDDQPAAGPLEEADARLRCTQELSRLVSETVTPRGLIAIERWGPGDKLGVADLAPALRQLGAGQSFLFSADPWINDPFIDSLVKTGQLVTYSISLDEAFNRLIQAGAATLGAGPGSSGGRHVIALGDGFVEIDIHTWNQVRRSARPVDLELLAPPVFSSEAARYREFRSFAGASEGSPRWRGIAAGMNIRRDYEGVLADKVAELLKAPNLPEPIIVSGQTATGKSVALAALAMDLAHRGDVAVLHQSRRTARPSLDDIDMYAAWADERGAEATVLVWDGMVLPGEYEALARQLRSRGRRVLVVGSAYVTDSGSSTLLPAPAELSGREISQLLELLDSFGIEVPMPKLALDSSFLTFLYYALPETESAIRSGLSNEMRAAEKGMEELVRERGSQATPEERLTAMAAALNAAGIFVDELLSRTGEDEKPLRDQTFDERSSIRKVTTLVLVAGRHGVPVPIDLALRILGREGSQSIRDALRSFDIVRELDDDNGEYFLTTRSRLEAELLARHELSLEVEIEVIVEIIQNLRFGGYYSSGNDEVKFVVTLLENIGPSAAISKYKRFYIDISDAFHDRRIESGSFHPRLVLQESTFARSYVHWQQETSDSAVGERISALEHNRDLLEEVLADPALKGMLRLALTVELASTLGAIVHEISAQGSGLEAVGMTDRLDDILKAVLSARAIDPSNLHPIDVLAWSTRDAIKAEVLGPSERLNRLANAIATLESVDRSSLKAHQLAQLDGRESELNKIIGNDDALWENLRNLQANADPAATYFLAKWEAAKGPEGENSARGILWRAPVATRQDWRCAQLLLELTWKKVTGQRLLIGERVPVNLSHEDLTQLSVLISDIGETELPDRHKLLFVKGFTEFVQGNFSDAKRTFREVESLTRQLVKRIRTLLVLANDMGEPRIFTGRVEWADSRSGEVWVEELATKVPFEPHLFSVTQEFSRHEKLPAFMIGFKLTRGPIAEPRSKYREARNR
jgi:hypothetical protein